MSRLLWLALVASTLAYLGVLLTLPGRPTPDAPMLLPVLCLVGLSTTVVSVLTSRFLCRSAFSRATPEIRKEPDASQVQYRDQIPMRPVFADPEAARRTAARLHRTSLIVGMALAEAIALFGFVLGFRGFGMANVIPFFVACWALMVWHFPRASVIEREFESVHRAKFC